MQTAGRFSYRKFSRWLLLIVGFILVLLLALHIWFVNNAKQQLIKAVHENSKGKYSLRLSNLSYNFLTDKLDIWNARLLSTNPQDEMLYDVSFSRLNLHIKSFWPLLLKKELLLDSIKLVNPFIQITQTERDTLKNEREVSIPKEMGKIYNSMLDMLDALQVKTIRVSRASFILKQAWASGTPVIIDNVFLNVIRYGNQPGKQDQVALVTHNQDIHLPGGRHKLSFKKFSLKLFDQQIELDSCTVSGISADTSSSSFNIYFDKLYLKGVDFAAMYDKDIVKADTVFCENPSFNFRINTDKQKSTGGPDFEKLVRELTGNFSLAYVGVRNAGIKIDIEGEKNRSLFNSHKDNFYIKGLQLNTDSSSPVSVDEFNMLVRDYRLYSNDSNSVYGFDSIHFRNNKILLNNFTLTTRGDGKTGIKNFSIPHFQLSGLDWYKLVFDENLVANEAILINPNIYYRKNILNKGKRGQGLFASLSTLDSLITLHKLTIVNGNVDLGMGATKVNLNNANLSISSNVLLRSHSKEGLRSAVDQFSIRSGNFSSPNFNLALTDAYYLNEQLLNAGTLKLRSNGKLNADFNQVQVKDILFTKEGNIRLVEGLVWKKGKIAILTSGNKGSGNDFEIAGMQGRDTKLDFNSPSLQLTTHINDINISSLKLSNQGLVLSGYSVNGTALNALNENLRATASAFTITEPGDFRIDDLQVQRYTGKDSMLLQFPGLYFTAPLHALLEKNIIISNLSSENAVIKIVKDQSSTEQNSTARLLLENLQIKNPDLDIVIKRNDSASNIRIMPGSNISLASLTIDGKNIQGKNLELRGKNLFYKDFAGKKNPLLSGDVHVQLENFNIQNDSTGKSWNARLGEMTVQNPDTLFMKQGNFLWLKDIYAGKLNLGSEDSASLLNLLQKNVEAIIRSRQGMLKTATHTVSWQNGIYGADKNFAVDSLKITPLLSLDEALAAQTHQQDYMHFKAGHIEFKSFDVNRFKQDSLLKLERLIIKDPFINIYRDKQKPFLAGKEKDLPTMMLMNLKFPIEVGQVQIENGGVVYTQTHEKSGVAADIEITSINGAINYLKNTGIRENDSLRINLQGLFMNLSPLQLIVAQSYADSFAGMRMYGSMKKIPMQAINPIIAPLSSIQLKSGIIDSFHFNVGANDYHAFGEMEMYYKNLKIKLVKSSDSTKTGFLQHIAGFFINSFILKRNAQGRKGHLYFERLRDRSFFNYVVKIAFAGITTTTGAKRSKTARKKYEQVLKSKKFPELISIN